VYLSVSKGPEDQPGLVRIDGSGAIEEIALDRVWFSKAELPDAPEDKLVGEGQRKRNLRDETITDLAFVDGQLIVSGLSNRESSSGVRSLAFPFEQEPTAASLEFFHGAHGRVEDNPAIRTFVPFTINGEPNLLAGFVCTPLVRFPLDEVRSSAKIRGTTVAELGNRNRPLDMFAYRKNGKDYIIMANDARGIMKITTDNVESAEALTTRAEGTAGLPFETISSWQDIFQLEQLDEGHALVIQGPSDGAQNLVALALP
jgi:hypothetical protein